MKIAEAAVAIKPSAQNYLALGSANLLNSNSSLAATCFDKVEKLDANYPGLADARKLISQ